MKNKESFFDTWEWTASFLAIIGMLLITDAFSMTSKDIGILILVYTIAYIFVKIKEDIRIKKSLKPEQIKNLEHRAIATYLTKNKHRYVYQPKEHKKIFDFYLPDINVYLVYWNENKNKQDEVHFDKKVNNQGLDVIKIRHRYIADMSKIHGSFSSQLIKIFKLRK